MRSHTTPSPALVVLEIDGVPTALIAHDAVLKTADVTVWCNCPTSPGKAILIFGGDVSSVESALEKARVIVGSRLIDELFLPGVHPEVITAVQGAHSAVAGPALFIVECISACATIRAADTAIKATELAIQRLHLATGFGGRGFACFTGSQASAETARDIVADLLGAAALDLQVIAAPHDELKNSAFTRPWGVDPV